MGIWWGIMVAVAAINFAAAVFLFVRAIRRGKTDGADKKYITLLGVLGLIFVTVALYRSVFVSSYPDRLAWFDTLFNSPLVVRCLALFAELSFIGMVSIVSTRLAADLGLKDDVSNAKLGNFLFKGLPVAAFCCIALAQFFAFGGLITQYLTLFAIEETLWALAFLSVVPLVIFGIRKIRRDKTVAKNIKAFFIIMAVWCAGYLAFQSYALPFMYYSQLAQDAGRVVPPDAFLQAITGFTVTHDYETWGGAGFFIWHSGYFSVCAWMALFFMTAPKKLKAGN